MSATSVHLPIVFLPHGGLGLVDDLAGEFDALDEFLERAVLVPADQRQQLCRGFGRVAAYVIHGSAPTMRSCGVPRRTRLRASSTRWPPGCWFRCRVQQTPHLMRGSWARFTRKGVETCVDNPTLKEGGFAGRIWRHFTREQHSTRFESHPCHSSSNEYRASNCTFSSAMSGCSASSSAKASFQASANSRMDAVALIAEAARRNFHDSISCSSARNRSFASSRSSSLMAVTVRRLRVLCSRVLLRGG